MIRDPRIPLGYSNNCRPALVFALPKQPITGPLNLMIRDPRIPLGYSNNCRPALAFLVVMDARHSVVHLLLQHIDEPAVAEMTHSVGHLCANPRDVVDREEDAEFPLELMDRLDQIRVVRIREIEYIPALVLVGAYFECAGNNRVSEHTPQMHLSDVERSFLSNSKHKYFVFKREVILWVLIRLSFDEALKFDSVFIPFCETHCQCGPFVPEHCRCLKHKALRFVLDIGF